MQIKLKDLKKELKRRNYTKKRAEGVVNIIRKISKHSPHKTEVALSREIA